MCKTNKAKQNSWLFKYIDMYIWNRMQWLWLCWIWRNQPLTPLLHCLKVHIAVLAPPVSHLQKGEGGQAHSTEVIWLSLVRRDPIGRRRDVHRQYGHERDDDWLMDELGSSVFTRPRPLFNDKFEVCFFKITGPIWNASLKRQQLKKNSLI